MTTINGDSTIYGAYPSFKIPIPNGYYDLTNQQSVFLGDDGRFADYVFAPRTSLNIPPPSQGAFLNFPWLIALGIIFFAGAATSGCGRTGLTSLPSDSNKDSSVKSDLQYDWLLGEDLPTSDQHVYDFLKPDASTKCIPGTGWTKSASTSMYYDEGKGLATDPLGNVYVTGSLGGQLLLRKYNSNGQELWTQTLNNISRGDGIAIDANGNSYVTGFIRETSTGDNIYAGKFDTNGNLIWTQSYTTPQKLNDYGNAITLDSAGNIYVAGSLYVPGQEDNIWLGKFNNSGNLIWSKTYNGPASDRDEGSGIAVDKAGNVYVSGYLTIKGTTIAPERSLWLGKYDNNGNFLWAQTYAGPEKIAEAHDVAIDNSGFIVVTGYVFTKTLYDILVGKYDGSGKLLWTKSYNNPAGTNPQTGERAHDEGYGITIDYNNNIYVTGTTTVIGEDYNIWARKHDTNGNTIWTKTFNTNNSGFEFGMDIAVDNKANVYLTGYTRQFASWADIWVHKFCQ